ncbi:thioesterase superfamily protein [Planoprotostelium fungivorum]|uniref:Acyl-coenzyme A thioesterase THEM4 n=1 Tax=Planoprotostelium fungivorum TaxID=1890364 RepID=A0A2P6NPA1_9EUKA|nr:thioesterase superfamily protein [Planoprotostelium fungivorum]
MVATHEGESFPQWARDLTKDSPGVIDVDRFGGSIHDRKSLSFIGEGYIDDKRFSFRFRHFKELKIVRGWVHFSDEVEGPLPGYVDGGCVSAIMDDLFGNVVWPEVEAAATVNLNIDHHHQVPLGSLVQVEATIDRMEGRKIFVKGEISNPDDGTIFVEARALFLKISQDAAKK